MIVLDRGTIRPTHSCFDDALDYLEMRILAEPDPTVLRDRLFVVHAICLAPKGPSKGRPFAHAWVEERFDLFACIVWESGALNGERIAYAMEPGAHEAWLSPQQRTRYTLREVRDHNRRTGTYGPWEPQYESLCMARGERVVFEP